MLTPYGVEGGGIYSLSRELMQTEGKATLFIDLLPDLGLKQIQEKLDKPRGKNSLSNHLRKVLNLDGAKFVLLKEKASSEELQDNAKLAFAIKNLRLELWRPRPIDEAISTIGGVKFENLDENLMLESIPGFYVIGEMLDWEAPTGGYLLQGCFSTAFAAVKGITENK